MKDRDRKGISIGFADNASRGHVEQLFLNAGTRLNKTIEAKNEATVPNSVGTNFPRDRESV